MSKPVAHKTTTAAPVTAVTEQPADGHGGNSLLQNEVLWIGVSFVICLVLFAKLLMPKIGKGLDGRADKIRDQLEQASRLRSEAQELLATYQRQQEEKLKEAEEIVASAKRDAAAMREQAAQDLKIMLDRRTQQAQEKIARAEAEAVSHIRTKIIDLATESARTTLAGQTDGAADELAISRAISAISAQIH